MIKMPDKAMRKLREILWTTHRLHDDTPLVVVAGTEPPHYAGGFNEGARMEVGLLWLRDNYPDQFAEAVSQRLQGETK